MLEAALTQSVTPDLQAHLSSCAACASEWAALRARREQLDRLLPLVTQEAELSPDFRARVLAAADSAGEAQRAGSWRTWGLAIAAAVILAALVASSALRQHVSPPAAENELAAAQKLAAWRAPTDIFLETPGRDLLRNTPKLGASYLPIPAQAHKEK